MKTACVTRVASAIAALLVSATLLSAQDTPMGDVARAARAQKSQAPHANKVLTDEDIGPQLKPIAETDDPAEVVNNAERAFQEDSEHTCRNERTNNSGPGSSVQSVREVAGPDHSRVVIDRHDQYAGHSELIVIGQDLYSRSGNGPWTKNAGAATGPAINVLPEALWGHYSNGEIKLVRRDVIDGTIVFLYETKYHPGGVSNRDRTIDFWISINDGRLRRFQMVDSEATASFIPPTVTRDTTTCTYGPPPEIKPPI